MEAKETKSSDSTPKKQSNLLLYVLVGLVLLAAATLAVLLLTSSDEPPTNPSIVTEQVVSSMSAEDYDRVYAEVVEALNVNEDELTTFVFFASDKVMYQDSDVITQAYNAGSGWIVAYQGTAAPSCDEVADLPEGYKISCQQDGQEELAEGDYTSEDPDYKVYFPAEALVEPIENEVVQ